MAITAVERFYDGALLADARGLGADMNNPLLNQALRRTACRLRIGVNSVKVYWSVRGPKNAMFIQTKTPN